MEDRSTPHITLSSYIAGFVLSLFLTLLAYFLVVKTTLDPGLIVAAIIGLALTQFFVQLVFFLHLGREAKPRWNLLAFLFMLLVVVIVVAGSLWIMRNLDYNMMRMPTERTDAYMSEQKDKGF